MEEREWHTTKDNLTALEEWIFFYDAAYNVWNAVYRDDYELNIKDPTLVIHRIYSTNIGDIIQLLVSNNAHNIN